jgi:hypothetical protein
LHSDFELGSQEKIAPPHSLKGATNFIERPSGEIGLTLVL